MTHALHLTNAQGRDATIGIAPVKAAPPPVLRLPGEAVVFRRYVAAAESGTGAALARRFGPDYAQQLIAGDPEVDMERVGMFIEQTQTVYLDGDGELLYTDPRVMELLVNADGTEKERREPVETDANVNAESPVRWTGRKIPLADALRRFAFKRRLKLQHLDGLSYDYLYAMASELESSQSLMLLGTGEKGSGPLIFQANGRPYRGFLEGRTQGKAYRLSLLLSDMELKMPAAAKPVQPAPPSAKAG